MLFRSLSWVALGFVAALALWLPRRSGSAAVNPVSVFVLPWYIAITLLLLPGMLSPHLTAYTVVLAVVGALGVAGGAVLGSAVPIRPTVKEVVAPSKVMRAHRILFLVLCGYVVLEVVRVAPMIVSIGGIEALWASTGNQFRTAQRLSRLQDLQSGGSVVRSLIGYALFMGHVSTITGGLLWRMGRRAWACAPLVALLLYTLVTLERTTFVIGALLFLFSVIAGRSVAPGRELRKAKGVRKSQIIVVTVGAIALLLPLYARNRGSANATGLSSLFQYAVSGVAGLNYRSPEYGGWSIPVDSLAGSVGDVPGYGAYTFYSFYDVLGRFGVPMPFAPLSGDYSNVVLGGQSFNTNIGTLLSDFYYDCGMLGVVTGCAGLGLVATVALREVRSGRVRLLGLYAVLMSGIAWSFFGNAVLTDVRYLLVAIVSYLVLRRCLGEGEADCRNLGLAGDVTFPRGVGVGNGRQVVQGRSQ